MRKLTIHRKKTSLGCAGKIHFYIEDNQNPEITINDVQCRYIGSLFNNDTDTFEIPNTKTKVYAISSSFSKNFSNDLYVIPEGDEDVYLSGKISFDLKTNCPFKFDNNNSFEAMENREKTRSSGRIITIIAIIIGVIIGLLITL